MPAVAYSCGGPCLILSWDWILASSGGDFSPTASSLPVPLTVFSFSVEKFAPCETDLWSSWAPLEIEISIWLALHNRLWTADRLAWRQLQHLPLFVFCCQEKNANHLLLGCPSLREMWYNVLLPLRLHGSRPSIWLR